MRGGAGDATVANANVAMKGTFDLLIIILLLADEFQPQTCGPMNSRALPIDLCARESHSVATRSGNAA